MMLSYQTLNGLKMTVQSITECVKHVLDLGAEFVLTGIFDHDPLEQQFGHYRHRGGSNRNPTVNEVRHILTYFDKYPNNRRSRFSFSSWKY